LGRVLMAKSFPLNGITVHVGELIGAWEGCKAAIFELGAKKLWLDCHALCVIKWIQDMSKADGGSCGTSKIGNAILMNLKSPTFLEKAMDRPMDRWKNCLFISCTTRHLYCLNL